jgi:hypothetical protein
MVMLEAQKIPEQLSRDLDWQSELSSQNTAIACFEPCPTINSSDSVQDERDASQVSDLLQNDPLDSMISQHYYENNDNTTANIESLHAPQKTMPKTNRSATYCCNRPPARCDSDIFYEKLFDTEEEWWHLPPPYAFSFFIMLRLPAP